MTGDKMRYLESFLLFASLGAAVALFEDQAGDFDWHQQFIGPVSYLAFDHSAQGSRRILLASERGVLATINARTGNITWRHVFEPEGGTIDAILHTKLVLVTVSHSGGVLRSWDHATGILKWEVATGLQGGESRSYPLHVQWRPNAVQSVLTSTSPGSLVVVAGGEIVSYSSRTGKEEWRDEIESNEVPCAVYAEDSKVHVLLATEQSKVITVTYNTSNGEIVSKQELSAPWLSFESTSCVITGGSIACLEKAKLDLYHTVLETGKRFSLKMLPTLEVESTSQNEVSLTTARNGNVWVEVDQSRWLVDLHGDVSIATHLDHTHFLETSLEGATVDVLLHYGGEELVIELRGEGLEEVEGSVGLGEERGRPVLGDAHFFLKADESPGYRLVLVMEDYTLVSLQQPGRVAWQREEALATVATLEMLDLPAGGQLESIEDFVSFAMAEGNPLMLTLQRLQLQAFLAKEFLLSLWDQGLAVLLPQRDSSSLVRDQFNTRKLIVAATENGKVYGLDSSHGGVVWQNFLSWLRPFEGGHLVLHILRSTSHPPHLPLAVLIGMSQLPSCVGSVLHAFNPLTGEAMADTPLCLSSPVIQSLLLPTVDHTHSRILLLLTSDLKVHAYPSTPEVTTLLYRLPEQLFFVVANTTSGCITGYQVASQEGSLPLSITLVWQLHFPADSEHITATVPKPANEPISSLGRVMADRSVQYKYLNPHLIAVTTESTDSSKPMVTVYLVDSVTGAVVHHTTHKQAVGPVHIVNSENWIVYVYFNVKQRRHELAVLELYETSLNQTHSMWSSLTPPPPPEVISQAYTFPSSLSTITTTHTLRGITLRNILLGLHSGHIASIPKWILDPRRELVVTADMKEEGLPPYSPELALKPVRFINYNQTVARLRTIFTAPSGLESTCLVVACGLDFYATRVTPSKQFDLLAEDFDSNITAAVVTALVVGTLLFSRLAARKTLRLLWK